jgi:hypothetical protein
MGELSWFTPSFPGLFASPSSVFLSRSEREISKLAQHSGKRSTLGEKHAHLSGQVPVEKPPLEPLMIHRFW